MSLRRRSREPTRTLDWPLILLVSGASALAPPVGLFLIGPFLGGNPLTAHPVMRFGFLTLTPVLGLGVILASARLPSATRATNGVRLARLLAVIALGLFALYAVIVVGAYL